MPPKEAEIKERKAPSMREGGIIPDDTSGDEYVLLKRLGRFGHHAFIFKALCYPKEYQDPSKRDSYTPTIYSLKLMSKYVHNQVPAMRAAFRKARGYKEHDNIVGTSKMIVNECMVGVAIPYMAEGSLRYIISQRFKNGIPEDCISIALREALLGLSHLHTRTGDNRAVHEHFSAGNIFVSGNPTSIKLAFGTSMYEHVAYELPDSKSKKKKMMKKMNVEIGSTSYLPMSDITKWGAAPEAYYDGYTPIHEACKSDVWLVGIAALELGYGCIPVSTRDGLEALIKKITKKKKLPLIEELIEADKKVGVVSMRQRALMHLQNKKTVLLRSMDRKLMAFIIPKIEAIIDKNKERERQEHNKEEEKEKGKLFPIMLKKTINLRKRSKDDDEENEKEKEKDKEKVKKQEKKKKFPIMLKKMINLSKRSKDDDKEKEEEKKAEEKKKFPITLKKKLKEAGKVIQLKEKKKVVVQSMKRKLQALKTKNSKRKEIKKIKAKNNKLLKTSRPFSKNFETMVLSCLAKRPKDRPTVDELLGFEFFTSAKNMILLKQTLLYAKGPKMPNDHNDDEIPDDDDNISAAPPKHDNDDNTPAPLPEPEDEDDCSQQKPEPDEDEEWLHTIFNLTVQQGKEEE